MSISPNTTNIISENVNTIMTNAYVEYSRMVCESRAIPSVLDGLKPVQRRILYSMYNNSISYHHKHRKSAFITGLVCAYFHPHGNESVYGALVNLAQDFVSLHPLIDGQGNFGSFDDKAAAQRYTEARLTKIANELFNQLGPNTVPMIANYDESTEEPKYLPAGIPLLLANGSYGIAVAISSKIPPHNIGELCNALLAYINNPNITVEEIVSQYMYGPDFPGGEYISSTESIIDMYKNGYGKLILKSKYHIEGDNIVFTCVPFQTSKLAIIDQIKSLITDKKLNECVWVRDETNKHGVRIVVKLTHEQHADVMVNLIFKHTPLKTSYHAVFYALDENRNIKLYNLLSYFNEFVSFQHNILIQNAAYNCAKAKDKLHIQIGLAIGLSNIEKIIEIIKSCDNKEMASKQLLDPNTVWKINYPEVIEILQLKSDKISFSTEQVNSILNIRLQSLVSMGIDEIYQTIKQLLNDIREYDRIVNDADYRTTLIKNNLQRIITTYKSKRNSEIINDRGNLNAKDFVISKEQLIMLTNEQYIKKIDLQEYHTQNRSGIGKQGGKELIISALMSNDRDTILLFTKKGYAFNLDCFRLPISSHGNRGRSIYQIMPKLAETNDEISYLQKIDEMGSYEFILFITKTGYVRKNYAKDFVNIRSNGKIYNKSDEQIISVILCNNDDYVMMATSQGKVTVLNVNAFSTMKQHVSKGVIGCRLGKGDHVIKAIAVKENDMVLTVLNTGFGRISSMNEYKVYKNRGGKGVGNLSSKLKQNQVTVADIIVINQVIKDDKGDSDVLIMTETQQAIRIKLSDIKESSRNTRGTKLLNNKDKISFAAVISNDITGGL